ncbi:MAG: FixH family protein [Pseudomonadota bacterium]
MSEQSSGFVLKGHHVLMAIIAFFGVIIAVNIVFVRLALDSFPGEQEKKSYLQGLNYNEVLAQRAEEEALGWKILLTRTPTSSGEGTSFELNIVDGDGDILPFLEVSGQLRRPTTDVGKVELVFSPLGGSRYRSTPIMVEAGAWDLTLVALEEGQEKLSAKTRLWIDENE